MLIAGKKIAKEIQDELLARIKTFSRQPGLAMVLVGDHPPSHTYVGVKKKACQEIGILSRVIQLPENTSANNLVKTIESLNNDPAIDGILVQSPLPRSLNGRAIMNRVHPDKDVDGFHPLNMGKLLLGDPTGFIPCTPLGVITLLQRSHLPIASRHVVIVGRSTIVGKPLAALMLQHDATVTVTHSKTQHLGEITKSADILVAAIGSPRFIKGDMVKEGAVVIDVGITREEKLVGDVDFDEVSKKASAITPVPGGVGPMTVAMLLQNTVLSYERRCKNS